MDQQTEGPPAYIHIKQNDFSYRKHKKQKEEDIAVCNCKFNATYPDSACGERCLNLLTSTECTPDYCPCGSDCKNQKFQKCEYAKTKLFKTEGRGWGLLADENIKAGQFVIEYCGEVISWKEARRRSHTYETQGVKDAFIISLNAQESIDATKKGSLARFINHSCQPNCETRKWTVLGELRVGIFAKQDIPTGTELAYNYNFEWFGGDKVRCLCGATCCSGFLGAKSRGFQEDTYLWEDDDDRYSVENIPLYDSEEDEPTSKLLKITHSPTYESNTDYAIKIVNDLQSEHDFQPAALSVQPLDSVPMDDMVVDEAKIQVMEDNKLFSQDASQTFPHKNAMISRVRSNTACRNGRSKHLTKKQVNAKLVGQLLASKEAREEVFNYEDMKNRASSQLDSLYDEIRPTIEEYEKDSQESVSTNVAERWIEASCLKMKAEFDLHSSIVKHVACTPRRKVLDETKANEAGETNPIEMEVTNPVAGGNENGLKYLAN